MIIQIDTNFFTCRVVTLPLLHITCSLDCVTKNNWNLMYIYFAQFMIKLQINPIERWSICFKKKIQIILPNKAKFMKHRNKLSQKAVNAWSISCAKGHLSSDNKSHKYFIVANLWCTCPISVLFKLFWATAHFFHWKNLEAHHQQKVLKNETL